MQFRCLGPVEVLVEGAPVDLGEPQRRLTLAMLMADADKVVSTDRLIDAIWGDEPPVSGRKIVQGYVSGLRKVLGDASIIESHSPGYRLNIKPQQLDAVRFRNAAADGAGLVAQDPGRAAEILRDGLMLWRGGPYEDLADFDALRLEIASLEQLRLTVTENLLAAQILGGAANEVVDKLGDLNDRHPLRERLWALRMLALYRCARPSEALRAYDDARGRLATEVGLEPSIELQLLRDRILQQDPVLDTLAALEPDDGERRAQHSNPYMGLRPFDEPDAPRFFGRDDLVRRLGDAVSRRGVPRLVVLTGASGTGKSSVVRAGMIPRLRAGGWSVTSMYPGTAPLDALAAARLEVDAEGQSLIVIDQLEELYTLTGDASIQADFLDTVADMVDPSTGGPWVVATIRADFLDALMGHRKFAGLLDEALMIVTPLADHEIRDVITKPVSRSGVTVEPDLVATMVTEVAHRPTALPLLQFALTDLFDRTTTGQITVDAYRAAGGIGGALLERVEELYAGLDPPEQETTRQLLLRLVALRGDNEPARRRVPMHSLVGLEGVESVVRSLGSLRLITFDRDADGERTVEVAHEALLGAWPRLRAWIEEASVALRAHAELADSATEWTAAGRDEAYLLTGARLVRLSEWDEADIVLTGSERAYLDASLDHEQRLDDRRRRRRRLTVGAFAAAAFVAIVFGVIAMQNARTADERARQATAEAWAASARAAIDQDPELSVLLGIEALELAPESAAAFEVLSDAVQAHRTTFTLTGGPPFVTGSISPDGTLVGMPSSTGTVEVWNVGDASEPLWEADVPGDGFVRSVLFADDGAQVIAYSGLEYQDEPLAMPEAGRWTIFDARTGRIVHSVIVDDPCVRPSPSWATSSNGFVDPSLPILMLRASRDPTSGLCAFSAPSGEAVAVSLQTGEIETLMDYYAATNHWGTMSADGSRYAFGPGGVYEYGAQQPLIELPPGMATMSANGAFVLAGDSPMSLIDVAQGTTIREYPGRYIKAVFSSTGRFIIAATMNGATRVFDTFGGSMLFELRGSGSLDVAVQMTTDEKSVATVAGDGSMRVWDVGSQLIGTASPVTYTLSSGDFIPPASVIAGAGRVLIPVGNDGTRRTLVFAAADGRLIRTLAGRAAALSPDGSTVIMQSWPRTLELDAHPGKTFKEVEGLVAVDVASGDALVELKGPCKWYNHTDVEVPGPDCGDYPDPWLEWVMSGSVSPDGTLFAMGGASGYVVVWDLESGEIVHFIDSLPGGNQAIFGRALVDFSPSGDELAVHQSNPGGGVALLRINSKTWEVEAVLDNLNSTLAEIEYTPDGSKLVTADWAANVLRVDANTWRIDAVLQGQQGAGLFDVSVSPDGRTAITAGENAVAWLWDLDSGFVLRKLGFPTTISDGGLLNVEFVDATTVLVSGNTSAVFVTLDPETLLDTALSRLTRTFTQPECATYGIDPCPTEVTEE